MTLLANGITRPMPLADALDVCNLLVATGRAIPAPDCVPWLARRGGEPRVGL